MRFFQTIQQQNLGESTVNENGIVWKYLYLRVCGRWQRWWWSWWKNRL